MLTTKEIMDIIPPVSYTHLDVYKRQEVFCLYGSTVKDAKLII